MPATVSVDGCDLERAIVVLEDAAREAAELAPEVTRRLPAMVPWLELALDIELLGIRGELTALAAQLVADATVQQVRLAEFGLADTPAAVGDLAREGRRGAAALVAGLGDMPAAISHDLGEGRQNFRANFQDLAVLALRPWAHADYLTFGIGGGPLVGVQATVSCSRAGYWYITPGLNLGTPGFGIFGGAGHVDTGRPATGEEIDGFLEGTTMAAGAFALVGGTAVSSPRGRPGARTGYETGFGTPQVELSASRGYRVPFLRGPTW